MGEGMNSSITYLIDALAQDACPQVKQHITRLQRTANVMYDVVIFVLFIPSTNHVVGFIFSSLNRCQ
jgi:hypothetical protein